MARLKKHGTELLRVEREYPANADRRTTWEKITRAYYSDGTVLQKHDLRWIPDGYHPNGELYSYGWKIFGKIKKDRTPQQAVATISASIKPDSKWRIVSGGPIPVVISQSRIVAAVQSGESIGFCKECGHEQDGLEPDARNCECEECGAMAVYGAEEMLF